MARRSPQDLRDDVKRLQYEFARDGLTMGRVTPLVRRAERLARWPEHGHLRDVYEQVDRARRTRDPAGPYWVLRAIERLRLAPSFEPGDRTPRGIVVNIGEYSPSDGWLYGVRSERGVFDRVWESTLVHPAQQRRIRVKRGKRR